MGGDSRRGWAGLTALLLALWAGGAGAQEPAYGTAASEIAEQIARAFPQVQGRIIGLERERVLVDLGKKDQVIPGLELQVYREGQEFKHPFTGQVLGKLDRDVGRVRILEVQPNFSLAEVIQVSEGTMVQQGDHARVSSARVILALPNVEVGDVAGANTRTVTRDLINALVKTNRFEVMPDQRIRAALAEEKVAAPEQFGDPATLQALWKRLRVSAVLLGKLSLMEKGVHWDVQVLSTVRGDSITLASAEVKGAAPRTAPAPERTFAGLGGRDAPRIDQIALRSQEVPFKGQALAAGDLMGDGRTTLALSDGQHVYFYSLERTGIKELARIPGEPTDNILALDAADINGNGVPEIFVTNFTNFGLRSFVLEYKEGKFQKISANAKLHFRVLDDPAGGHRLFAQGGEPRQPFDGPVRRYTWQAGAYRPTAETVPLPRLFNRIYGFTLADLDGDGAPEVLVLDHQDYLRVFDRGGKEIYRSSDRYGGSENLVEYDPAQVGDNPRSGIEPERVMLQSRMYFQDVAGNGKRQLILPRNVPSTGYVWRTRLYDRGKIFGLAWDGVGLQQAWETRDLPGYVADYALLGPEGSGGRKVVLLVVQTNLLGHGGSRSSVILLDLKPQG